MSFSIPSMKGFINKVNIGSSGGWTPANLSGLKFWVRSDQGFTPSDGSTSATWNDLSGNGRNLIASAAGNYITKESTVLGSKDGIKFTWPAYFTSSPNTMSALYNANYPNNFIIVFVYRYFGNGNTQEGFYQQDQQSFYLYNGTWQETYGFQVSSLNSEMDTTNAMILTGTSSTVYTITNNRYGATTLTYPWGTYPTMASSVFNIAKYAYGISENTYFGEVIVATSASTEDISNLKTYLNNYWNFNYLFS